MKQRNGSTLLEVTIAIPICFALLISAIGLVHKAMVVSNLAKNQAAARRSIGNLSQQFRNDVHEAKTAQLVMDERIGKKRLMLGRPNHHSVVYELGNAVIRRVEGDVHQEQFLIPGLSDARFELFEEKSRTNSRSMKRIRLTLMRPTVMRPTVANRTDDESNTCVDAEIEATLGIYASTRTGKESHE